MPCVESLTKGLTQLFQTKNRIKMLFVFNAKVLYARVKNNAIIIMLRSNRKIIIIIIKVLYSIWKQYKIEIGQFGTEDIGIWWTQFMCLMFSLKSWNFSVKEPNEHRRIGKCNVKTVPYLWYFSINCIYLAFECNKA